MKILQKLQRFRKTTICTVPFTDLVQSALLGFTFTPHTMMVNFSISGYHTHKSLILAPIVHVFSGRETEAKGKHANSTKKGPIALTAAGPGLMSAAQEK